MDIEYEGLHETLEISADKNLKKSLKKADEDVKKGRLYSHKEVFGGDALYEVMGIGNIKDDIAADDENYLYGKDK